MALDDLATAPLPEVWMEEPNGEMQGLPMLAMTSWRNVVRFHGIEPAISGASPDSGCAPARLEALDSRLLLSAGDLDSGFGPGGMFPFNFGSGDDFGYAVAIQADGRIVAAGTVLGPSGTSDFGLVRFMPDGSLDTSFGSGGFVTSDFGIGGGTAIDEARRVAIDSSGRIYVSGWTNQGFGNDFALARYNPDGTLDTSFGASGVAINTFNGNDQAYGMALQPDGKVVLAGLISNDFGVVRYNTDGSLDASFGNGGWVRTSTGSALDLATCVAIGPGGKIYAGGYAQFSSNFDFTAAVYNPDGTLDTTLNGTGMVRLSILGTVDQPSSIAVMPDGRFVLAGRNNGNVMIVRYNPIGSRDTTFTPNGIANIDLGTASDTANDLLLLDDGSMLLVGGMDTGTLRDFAVFRVTATGTLDPSFGSGGIARSNFSGDSDEAFGLALDANGKLVVVGRTTSDSFSTGNYDFALARYQIGEATNQPPQAAIGGPGSVEEGSSMLLDGSGSFDPDGSIVSYDWDFDYDGTSFDVDTTGSSTTFSAANLDGPTSRTVALRVTDDQGESHIVTHSIDVTNADPSATLSGPTSGEQGQELSFTVNFSDPGAADTHRVRFDFGDGTIVEVDATGSSVTMSHSYGSVGDFNVTVTVLDDDGGSGSASMTVAVVEPPPPPLYQFIPDPQHPGKMMLVVNAGDGDDIIRFKHYRNRGIELRVNGERLGIFNVTSRIVAHGGGGNDILFAQPCVGVPVQFYGEGGDDVLKGSNKGDTLDGGDGNDMLFGRRGNDLLLGGAGNDTLLGQSGHDTLEGGDGRDMMKDRSGRNTFVYDDDDWRPKKAKKAKRT